MTPKWRGRRASVWLIISLAAMLAVPSATQARSEDSRLTADLDGKPMRLADVGKWYCEDFEYPAIHCYSTPELLAEREAIMLAFGASDYVTVYELTGFAGSFMHMSQDYNALVTIGWSDRISSLKGRNSASSTFFVDWFYGGSSFGVCCNTQLTSLGGFDNSFSSVRRN